MKSSLIFQNILLVNFNYHFINQKNKLFVVKSKCEKINDFDGEKLRAKYMENDESICAFVTHI